MPIKRKRQTPTVWHKFPADPDRNMGERYYRDGPGRCVAEVEFKPPFATLMGKSKRPAYFWAAREPGPPDPLGNPTLWPFYESDFGLDSHPSVFTGRAKTLAEAKNRAIRACAFAHRKQK